MNEYLYWDQNNPLYLEIIKELRKAYISGLSVVQLSRILGHKSAKKLYAVLRNERIIAKIKRKRQVKYLLHELVEKCVMKTGLSFLQWCSSHSLDPGATATALTKPLDPDDSESCAAHCSFATDFPMVSASLFGTSVPLSQRHDWNVRGYSMTINYDVNTKVYHGVIPEMPNCSCTATNLDRAFLLLKKEYVMHVTLMKLRSL
jgi:hypothetical protein